VRTPDCAGGRQGDQRIPVEEPIFSRGVSPDLDLHERLQCPREPVPADGTLAYRHYPPGKFLNAADEKASRENEQSSLGLQTARGPVLVRQIAGLVARRIVTIILKAPSSTRETARIDPVREPGDVFVRRPPSPGQGRRPDHGRPDHHAEWP